MVKVHLKCDRILVSVSTTLLQSGWYGGQWVRYTGKRTVDLATKDEYAGFLVWGHRLKDVDGKPYDYRDMDGLAEHVPYQHENKAVTAQKNRCIMIAGGGDFDFNKNAYDTTKTYTYNQLLYINDNSVLTNVNVGSPPVGMVNAIPEDNNNWLGMTLKF